jgi:hypothetical protein
VDIGVPESRGCAGQVNNVMKVPEDGLEGTGEMHGGTQRPLLPMCSSTSAHWRL